MIESDSDNNFLAGGNDSQNLGDLIPYMRRLSFEEWLNIGIEKDFCGAIICLTHDGIPQTLEEEENGDLCVPIIRLYETKQQKTDIENNHPPSKWRQTNQEHTH